MSVSRNPPWTSDEIILALNLYRYSFPAIPQQNSEDVMMLSSKLRRLCEMMGGKPNDEYRNPNGVHMKLMNFHHVNPHYDGQGLKGGSKLDRELFERYWENPKELRSVADRILTGIESGVEIPPYDEEDDTILEPQEGRFLIRLHRSRERNRKIVDRKKAQVLKQHNKLECECCGFDFQKTYGDRGAGFIECHHKKPVSEIEIGRPTRLQDLALVCSNCHRMIHRTRPWLSVQALQAALREAEKLDPLKITEGSTSGPMRPR